MIVVLSAYMYISVTQCCSPSGRLLTNTRYKIGHKNASLWHPKHHGPYSRVAPIRGRNDCLLVPSDRQNFFSPVYTNIQLEQYCFNMNLHYNHGHPSVHFSLNLNTSTLLCFIVCVSKFCIHVCTSSASVTL